MSEGVTSRIDDGYKHLLSAEITKQSTKPLTDLYPDLSVSEAYRIQIRGVEQKVSEGKIIVGKKIGLTSIAMQKLLGVNQPDYGHLLDYMETPNHSEVSIHQLFQPKVEGEIAFVLRKTLKGPSVTLDDVLDATEYIVPALEVVDSRIIDWKIKLSDTIADNASCGLYVLGEDKFTMEEIDLTKIEMKLYKNGEFVNSGKGSDVLGHPAKCVAWLANELSKHNVGLEAGEVILSGALSAAVEAKTGDYFKASSQLGSVEITFK